MANARKDDLHIDDPALEGGDWVFRKDGQVFGPLSSREIAKLLYRGQLDARTPVSSGDGRWTPVGDVPLFLVHARKAEAALRVEREVTGARELARRRSRRAAVAITVSAVLLVGGAVGGAYWVAKQKSEIPPELQGFPPGITVASAARVGVGRRAAEEDEVEVAIEPEAGRPGRRAPGAAGAPRARPGSAADVGEGDLVVAQFDSRKIQSVVGREQRTLAPCFKAESDRSPDFQGDIPIEFAIGNDGRVASLWIDEPRFKNGALRECLERALGAWRFDAFPGQRPTVSLAFHIGR
jgi:hypothetical protein